MTVSSLKWLDSMNAVRAARRIINPNIGFQKQLETFQKKRVRIVRNFRLKVNF